MSGDQPSVVVQGDLAGADPCCDPQADQADRHRVAVLADRDQGLGVDPGPGRLGGVEGLGWQRAQKRRLPLKRLAHRFATAADRAAQVETEGGSEAGVQLGEVGDLGDGDEVVAAKAPDLTLHAALLMGALLAAAGELRGEQVVGAQRHEAVRLHPAAAFQHFCHGGAQIVVADGLKDAAEELKGADVALQEGLLGLAPEGLHEAGPREAGAHQEEVDGAALAAQADLGLAPVDLGLGGRVVDQRHESFVDQDAELGPALAHVAADLALGYLRAVLVDQPFIDAVGGMSLLGRRLAVGDQPSIDRLPVRAQRRCRSPSRLLSRRRQRRLQRLAHGAAVNAVALGQGADGRSFSIVVSAYLLEQLHS